MFSLKNRSAAAGRHLQGMLLVSIIGMLAVNGAVQAAPVQLTAAQARWQREAQATTITRDNWGIPHVHGKTNADAVFGMIYAQAEDDFNRIEVNYLTQLGWLARSEGKRAIWSDLRAKMYIDHQRLKQRYAASPAWLKRLMNAWADGLNYFLATHPNVHPRVIHHFEPWMALAFTEGSIGGDITFVPLPQLAAFYGDHDPSLTLAGAVQRGVQGGSNGIAIAPKLTAHGHTLLLINPHVTFYFRTELQMSSDQGLDAYGAVTWGQFFIYQGFNKHIGWMHTSTGADNIDQFEETIVHKDGKLFYRYGKRLLPVKQRRITVQYRTADGKLAARVFTAYFTNNGPVTGKAGGKWISTRMMDRPVARLEQSWKRMLAHDFAAYRKLDELKANSSNNTVFAGDKGEVAMLMPQFVAKRDNRFDYTQPVDGSNPATAWQGATPLSEMPNIIDPPNGWVVNTNNAPWFDGGKSSPKKQDYPAYMDTFGQNPRGIHALRMLKGAHGFTPGTLINDAYDSYMPPFARLIPVLVSDYDALPRSSPLRAKLAGPISVLRGWNDRWGITSIPTTLAMLWGDTLWQEIHAGTWSEEMSVYKQLAAPAESKARLSALAEVVDRLHKDFGTWATPWGEVNRYQRLYDNVTPDSCFCSNEKAQLTTQRPFDDSKPSIPIPFTSARWGSLASFGAHYWPGTKRYYGFIGNSFVAVIEFGPKVHAWAIKVGGESGHPDSPHFTDQAERYAMGDLREVYFWPDELKGHVERVYHPGQ